MKLVFREIGNKSTEIYNPNGEYIGFIHQSDYRTVVKISISDYPFIVEEIIAIAEKMKEKV